MTVASTADRILDVAEDLVQTRGYGAFSYADIADQLRLRKASIHHHFASKGELTRAVAARYRAAFREKLRALETRQPDPGRRLKGYVRLFQEALRQGDHMCLYGMLAADFASLPEAVRGEVTGFFDDQEAWLTRVLDAGQKAGRFRFAGKPQAEARMLFAALEGAMLVARTRGEVGRFTSVAAGLIRTLSRRT